MEALLITLTIMIGLCYMVSHIRVTIDHKHTSDDRSFTHVHHTDEQPKPKLMSVDELKKEADRLAELNDNRPPDAIHSVLGKLTEFMTGGELDGEDNRAKE